MGVNVKREGDLFLFKYDQLLVDWNAEIPLFCRGTICRQNKNGWEVVSQPYRKFFNLQEPRCNFSNLNEDSSLVEKVDGTCIQVWYDETRNDWRASTLGTITTTSVNNSGVTFDQLFWSIFGDQKKKLDSSNTYIFELCTDLNQIVTRYDSDRVYLLGVFSKKEKLFLSSENFRNLDCFFPFSYKALDICSSREDLIDWVERASSDIIYGKNPEGFVLYESNHPTAKLKNARYLALHAIGGGDIKCSKNRLIDLFFEGLIDDVEGDLNDNLKLFVSNLKNKVSDIIQSAVKAHRIIVEENPTDRKTFAKVVNDIVDVKVRPAFFRNYPLILQKDFDLISKIEGYLKENYSKMEWSE